MDTHPDDSGLVCHVTLEARPRGGPLGFPYTAKNLEQFQMAVQRLVLIHPRELEIPKMEDIGAVSLKAFLKDAEKVIEDIEKMKITSEKVTQDSENKILMDIEKNVSLDDENNTDAVCDQNTVKALVRQESSDY